MVCGLRDKSECVLWRCALDMVACEADCAANAQVHQLTRDTIVT